MGCMISSGKETGEDRQTVVLCLSRCPSHCTWVLLLSWKLRNYLSLRLRECEYCISNLSDVHLWAPNPNNTVPTSFGISNLECVTCQVRFRINYWRACLKTATKTDGPHGNLVPRAFLLLTAHAPWFYPAKSFMPYLITRDTFIRGKLTFLLYCITFSIVKWHLPHVNVSRANMASVALNVVVNMLITRAGRLPAVFFFSSTSNFSLVRGLLTRSLLSEARSAYRLHGIFGWDFWEKWNGLFLPLKTGQNTMLYHLSKTTQLSSVDWGD